jgi:hypothetical protein
MAAQVTRVDYATDELRLRWTGCGINEMTDVDMVGRLVLVIEVDDVDEAFRAVSSVVEPRTFNPQDGGSIPSTAHL